MINLLIFVNNFESKSKPRKIACIAKNKQDKDPKQKNVLEKLNKIFLSLKLLNKCKLFFQQKNKKIALKTIKGLKMNVAG